MAHDRFDPFAGCPETTRFMLLLPSAILDDEDRRGALIDRLHGAFPELTFCAAACERLEDADGKTLVIDEPLAIPMVGTAGDGSRPTTNYRRPSPGRMAEINAALTAFIAGQAGLN